MFGNFVKTTHRHMFNITFRQNFQNSHQTDALYRNGMQNLRRRDICAPGKELLYHVQLK